MCVCVCLLPCVINANDYYHDEKGNAAETFAMRLAFSPRAVSRKGRDECNYIHTLLSIRSPRTVYTSDGCAATPFLSDWG